MNDDQRDLDVANHTVIVHLRAKSSQVALVKAELDKLVPIVKAEAGCVFFHLHRDNDDAGHFMMLEGWESREAWQAHMETPHVAAFLKAIGAALAYFATNELTQLI